MNQEIYIEGMHGLGDNIHQRAIVRHYVDKGFDVTLATPWPQIYWDMPVRFNTPNTNLRAQAKNILLHRNDYVQLRTAPQLKKKIWYSAQNIQKYGSFLDAMLYESGTETDQIDFKFRVKPEWKQKALDLISKYKGSNTKPILFYRPLIERKEWAGCSNRNPDINAYTELINYVKDKFYVVSVADTQPNVEWISGGDINSDLKLHRGELDFETMSGLMSISKLAFVSPGFGLVLAQSLGIPNICVYGGRENSKMYLPGNKISKSLGIDTISPCSCFNHNHNCEKKIDVPAAKIKIDKFLSEIIENYTKPITLEKVAIPKAILDLSCIPDQHRKRFFNPGELETLATLLSGCKRIAEFGCQNGRTAKVLIHNLKGIEKYIGIDVPPNYQTACNVQRTEVPKQAGELALDEDKFTLLLHKKGTVGIHDDLPELDAIFIDGDHSYEGVIHDHNLAKLKIKNGIIIHHDYHDLGTVGVKDALHFLSKDNKIVHVDGTWFCYQLIGDFKL